MEEELEGFVVPVHQALTTPLLMAAWMARHDPQALDVLRAHLSTKPYYYA